MESNIPPFHEKQKKAIDLHAKQLAHAMQKLDFCEIMPKKKSPANFEEKLQHIRQIADRLQRETLSLDESMALFKEADELIRESRLFLEEAGLQVEALIDFQTGEKRKFE
jgi:exodeoxyribonuclease VII small subunit